MKKKIFHVLNETNNLLFTRISVLRIIACKIKINHEIIFFFSSILHKKGVAGPIYV